MQGDDDYNYNDEEDPRTDENRPNKESNIVTPSGPLIAPTEYTTTVKSGETAVIKCNVHGMESNTYQRIQIANL